LKYGCAPYQIPLWESSVPARRRGTNAARWRFPSLFPDFIQDGGIIMPVLLGIILGVLLTIAGAFAYDTTTGRAPNGLAPTAAEGQPPMVNWDVVGNDWVGLKSNLREMETDLQKGWKKITG
jgi:hypothetical protein